MSSDALPDTSTSIGDITSPTVPTVAHADGKKIIETVQCGGEKREEVPSTVEGTGSQESNNSECFKALHFLSTWMEECFNT